MALPPFHITNALCEPWLSPLELELDKGYRSSGELLRNPGKSQDRGEICFYGNPADGLGERKVIDNMA